MCAQSILWSGVFERSFGMEYWSGIKFVCVWGHVSACMLACLCVVYKVHVHTVGFSSIQQAGKPD